MTQQEILSRLGIDALSAMQQEAIEASRRHRDLILLSPTGSGKTLAYLLPLAERLESAPLHTPSAPECSPRALIVVPTRELAQQTHAVVQAMRLSSRAMPVYGGRPAMDEHRTMRESQPDIIIGTPGRLVDHLRQGNITLSSLDTLVIDEFDKALELGFQTDMQRVMEAARGANRHVLLSATRCPEIPEFIPSGHELDFTDPNTATRENIEVGLVVSPEKDKLTTLARLLAFRREEQTLVFVGYRESVDRVCAYLRKEGFAACAYHGGMEQQQRERALYQFAGGARRIMVSTDLASRGLDIPLLDNIVHYHLPCDRQAYIHRNGRTARWDKQGRAYLILGPEETLPDYIQPSPTLVSLPAQTPPPCPPRWITLYIGKGKRDKLSRGDVAGFLMKVGGLERDDVGRIDVRDHYTYVSINRKKAPLALASVKGQKIKGIKTIVEVSE